VAGIRRLVGDSVLLVEDGASRSTERARKEGDENGGGHGKFSCAAR
jgi:hypothetical protein